MWRDVKKIILSNEVFLLTTHVNPDGDGVGASVALAELLLMMGKKVRFVCDGPLPDKFAFIDVRGLYEQYGPERENLVADVMVVLDTHCKERIGRVEARGATVVCIDHHTPGEMFTPHVALDPKASSAGAMIYTLFKESGYALNFNAAQAIYASIVWDTGRFSYSSTDRKAHKIADECIKLGVDPDTIHSRLFQRVPVAQIPLFARALGRMEVHLEGRVVVQTVTIEDCRALGIDEAVLKDLDLGYIHEFNKWIENVECAIFLCELPSGGVRLSMRSQGDVDLSKVVQDFGGGGHAKAAGALSDEGLNTTKERVLALIRQQIGTKIA